MLTVWSSPFIISMFTSCLHHLLPEAREYSITSRLMTLSSSVHSYQTSLLLYTIRAKVTTIKTVPYNKLLEPGWSTYADVVFDLQFRSFYYVATVVFSCFLPLIYILYYFTVLFANSAFQGCKCVVITSVVVVVL